MDHFTIDQRYKEKKILNGSLIYKQHHFLATSQHSFYLSRTHCPSDSFQFCFSLLLTKSINHIVINHLYDELFIIDYLVAFAKVMTIIKMSCFHILFSLEKFILLLFDYWISIILPFVCIEISSDHLFNIVIFISNRYSLLGSITKMQSSGDGNVNIKTFSL